MLHFVVVNVTTKTGTSNTGMRMEKGYDNNSSEKKTKHSPVSNPHLTLHRVRQSPIQIPTFLKITPQILVYLGIK